MPFLDSSLNLGVSDDLALLYCVARARNRFHDLQFVQPFKIFLKLCVSSRGEQNRRWTPTLGYYDWLIGRDYAADDASVPALIWMSV